MPPREDIVLMLDLETTGAENTTDDIVQVAVVALSAPSWHEIASFNRGILPTDEGWDRMMGTKIVREMHEKSGLLSALESLKALPREATPQVADDALIEWLGHLVGSDTTHIPYGGSGVMHFDREFIKRQLPRFNKRITYWALDVGPVRRIARIAGRTDWPVQNEDEKHDALRDARFHADEFRFALNVLRPPDVVG